MSDETETQRAPDHAELGTLARVLHQARLARGWSLRETAREACLNPMQLSRLERGELKAPSPHTLFELGRALDLPYADLMRLSGYATPVEAGSANEESPAGVAITPGTEGLLLRAAAPFTEDELEAMLAFLRYYRQRNHAHTEARVERPVPRPRQPEEPADRPDSSPAAPRTRRKSARRDQSPPLHHAS
jgi:transcriptional regulator with XRE-family HTH domain